MLKSRLCPLCDAPLGAALLTIAEPDRFEKALGIAPEGYWRAWRACEGCGAGINEHLEQNAAKLQTLAESYYEVDLGNGIEAKYRLVMGLPEEKSDNAGRARRVLNKLLALREAQRLPVPTSIKAADIGAGTGVFLAKLGQLCGERGIRLDAVAIEPDPIAAAHLRQLGSIRVQEATLDEGFGETGFDLVTFNKVLEHIEFPSAVVAQSARIADPDKGLVYAEVPDVETIHHRPANDNILGALHWHLYALDSMDGMLRRGGVVPLELQRIFEPSGKLTVFSFAVSDLRYRQLASVPK